MSLSDVPDCAAACPLAAAPVALPLASAAGSMDRRVFLTRATLAAAATALAACGGGGSDPTSPASVGASLRVADYPALASVGGIASLTLSGTPIAVVRTGAATFVTLSRVCPHERTTVNQSGSGFLCPNHQARFDATGTWVGGQRTSNLTAYATTYDAAAGTLQIG